MFSTIDTQWLLNLNGLAISNRFWYDLTYFGAHYLVYAIFLFAIFGIALRKDLTFRGTGMHVFVQSMLSIALATAVGFILAAVINRARPFQDLINVTPIGSLPGNSSFPSAHTWISFAFAGTFLFHEKYRKLGFWLVAIATMIGVGRVAAGLHYPSDVLGGALLGLLSAYFMVYFSRPLLAWLGRWSEK